MPTAFEYPRGDGFTIGVDDQGFISIEQTTCTDDSFSITLSPMEAKVLVDQINKILLDANKVDSV